MAEIRVADQNAGGQGTFDDPAVARAEIQQTRARMSDTIEEIESVLVRKKEQVQNRFDILSPVRERPLPAAGGAFGVGLLLGLITGGSDDDHDDRPHRIRHYDVEEAGWEDRADHWETRARRLLSIAREQEEEIRSLQERFGEMRAEALERSHRTAEYVAPREQASPREADDDLHSTVSSLRNTIAGGVVGFLSDTLHHLMQESRSSRA